MVELLAMRCDMCGEPMVPDVSTLAEHGCHWICIDPQCPAFAVDELEAADLAEAGVPPALAGRLARLIDFYVGQCAERPRTSERAQADLATLRGLLQEMGRLAEAAGAVALHLNDALAVSFQSDDFDQGQAAKESLAVTAALCCTVRRTVADAASRVDTIDPRLPGLMPFGQV